MSNDFLDQLRERDMQREIEEDARAMREQLRLEREKVEMQREEEAEEFNRQLEAAIEQANQRAMQEAMENDLQDMRNRLKVAFLADKMVYAMYSTEIGQFLEYLGMDALQWRDDEQPPQHYHFTTEEDFDEMIEDGDNDLREMAELAGWGILLVPCKVILDGDKNPKMVPQFHLASSVKETEFTVRKRT